MPHPTDSCPTCGGPVAVASADEGTNSYVPALTGAQVDAAYRMVAAVKAWLGKGIGRGMHPDSDLVLAARDFEMIDRGLVEMPTTHALGRDPHEAKDEHLESMRKWANLSPERRG